MKGAKAAAVKKKRKKKQNKYWFIGRIALNGVQSSIWYVQTRKHIKLHICLTVKVGKMSRYRMKITVYNEWWPLHSVIISFIVVEWVWMYMWFIFSTHFSHFHTLSPFNTHQQFMSVCVCVLCILYTFVFVNLYILMSSYPCPAGRISTCIVWLC